MKDRNVIAALHGLIIGYLNHMPKLAERDTIDTLLNAPHVQACQPDLSTLACATAMRKLAGARLVYTYGFMQKGYYRPLGRIIRLEYITHTNDHEDWHDHNYCFSMEKPKPHKVVHGFNSVTQSYVPGGMYLLVMDEEDYKLDLLTPSVVTA